MTIVTLISGKKFKVIETPAYIKSRMYLSNMRKESHFTLTKVDGFEVLVDPSHIVSVEQNG